ncbi:hypothetical protein BGX30_009349, partial [Mortierella sp. GBA39]
PSTTTTTSQLAAGDIESRVSLSTALDQGGLLSEDQEDTLPDEDEERISELMAREAKDRETKRLKTVTVPLKDIVRMELTQQKVHEGSAEDSGKDIMAADKLHDTLQNKQVTLTNATEELASKSESLHYAQLKST